MRRAALALVLAVAATSAYALDALPGAREVTFDGKRLVLADSGRTPAEHWREFLPAGVMPIRRRSPVNSSAR
ncbi:MAG: hypothetical protein DYH14_14865 [Betaproteobacteria bacterium PRO3]|nr:hypothetical protein [Betaproteobacteria bacterium PRO3]